jgi:anhydro-N-acetylmuramic acid kinase
MESRLIIGAMSGTSADGVDAALVRIEGVGLAMTAELVAHAGVAFDAELRARVHAVRAAGRVPLDELARLGTDVARVYAAAVREVLSGTAYVPGDIAAVAAHGQTLFHAPPLSIQWLDPAYLAWASGIDVIGDFRRADLAAGGQGAPLVPYADYVVFRCEDRSRVLLNLGGIANVTWLPRAANVRDLVAFDTGPGNCLSDWLMRQRSETGANLDVGGALALGGEAIEDVVTRFLADDYFRRPPPKSTDGPAMISTFERALGDRAGVPLGDLLATAAACVSRSVIEGLKTCSQGEEFDLIVAGGGVHNAAILAGLAPFDPAPSDAAGVPAEAREAMAFAILGAATLDRQPANVVRATGALRPVVLGAVWPKP